MDETLVRGIRRRKPTPPMSEEPGRVVDPPSPELEQTSQTGQTKKYIGTPVAPLSPRERTDFDGLRQVAEMDPAEVAAMMEAYGPARSTGAVRTGQRLRGSVSRLTSTLAFVSIGGKADASIERVELPADIAVGSPLDAYVVSTKDGEVRLSMAIGGDSTREMLGEAVENRSPVQGKVVSRNDHGFNVLLSGGVRGFCPLSQIDHSVDPDLDSYVGRSLAFRVLDVRGRDAIVSHRAIAEVEAREVASRAMADIKEGEVYDGTVTGIREFGAFVRIGPGLEGLVRLPNLSKLRVNNPSEAVTEGQAVRVRVLSVDTARSRLDLGIRQVEESDAPNPGREGRSQPMTTGGTFGTLGALLQDVKVSAKRK